MRMLACQTNPALARKRAGWLACPKGAPASDGSRPLATVGRGVEHTPSGSVRLRKARTMGGRFVASRAAWLTLRERAGASRRNSSMGCRRAHEPGLAQADGTISKSPPGDLHNQIRMKIGVMFGNPRPPRAETRSSLRQRAPRHPARRRTERRREGRGQPDTVKVVKNKMARRFARWSSTSSTRGAPAKGASSRQATVATFVGNSGAAPGGPPAIAVAWARA